MYNHCSKNHGIQNCNVRDNFRHKYVRNHQMHMMFDSHLYTFPYMSCYRNCRIPIQYAWH